jgi:DNA-binding NtrC family response regulator
MKSKIGEGTTFDLYLPALSEAEAFESDIEDKTSISGHGEKILVLDDDPIQLEIAESLFRELNYNVKTVNEHENIINEIDIFEPDIFVMDMILSDGTDGLDVYKIIREKHKNLKVVIISGFSESERVLDALKLGVRKFISKPFTIQEIGRGVREVLDQKK